MSRTILTVTAADHKRNHALIGATTRVPNCQSKRVEGIGCMNWVMTVYSVIARVMRQTIRKMTVPLRGTATPSFLVGVMQVELRLLADLAYGEEADVWDVDASGVLGDPQGSA